MTKSRRGPVSAGELMAELDRRLVEDPEYRAEVEALEARELEEGRQLREAERPIISDLAAVGIVVDSPWNLYTIPDSRPKAIPVLLDHLIRPYPDKVVEGIGGALAHKSAREWWTRMKAIYLETENETVRDSLAAALSGIATRVHYDDLLLFLGTESL